MPVPYVLESSSMTFLYFELLGFAIRLISIAGSPVARARSRNITNIELER